MMAGLGLYLAALPLEVRGEETWCDEFRITGYSLEDFGGGITADGTRVDDGEPIAAASYDVALGSYADVEGLGVFRIADRGSGLHYRHLDILVATNADAYAITGWRWACVESTDG